ncbi:hypothetical protein FOWG_18234 [Fusarium oxysporum f. sp. lycopersici MN25]|nr:hypothetical protein FOWG_18234 [Fusarium oxysporum f. sp. lycopersici MN25]
MNLAQLSLYSAILLDLQAAPDYRGPFQLLTPPRTRNPAKMLLLKLSMMTIDRRPDSWIRGETASLIPSQRTTRPRCSLHSQDGASLV